MKKFWNLTNLGHSDPHGLRTKCQPKDSRSLSSSSSSERVEDSQEVGLQTVLIAPVDYDSGMYSVYPMAGVTPFGAWLKELPEPKIKVVDWLVGEMATGVGHQGRQRLEGRPNFLHLQGSSEPLQHSIPMTTTKPGVRSPQKQSGWQEVESTGSTGETGKMNDQGPGNLLVWFGL